MSYVTPFRNAKRLLRSAPKSSEVGWRLRDTVDSVLENGLGRYVCQLQRLTFVLDKTREDSGAVRTYIKDHLPNFADSNPGVVVYVLPKRHKSPYLVGEYLNGRQASVTLFRFDVQEIERWVEYFRTRSGRRIAAFEHNMATQNPSIQGMWDPFVDVDTSLNVCDDWPSQQHSTYEPIEPTATQQIRQIYLEQKKEANALNSETQASHFDGSSSKNFVRSELE